MTTTDSTAEAHRLAELLVLRRLAACVQVMPVRSHYRWQGRLENSEEALLLAKTSDDRYDEVEALLLAEHTYDVPEVVRLPVSGGSAAYLSWVDAETAGDEPGSAGD